MMTIFLSLQVVLNAQERHQHGYGLEVADAEVYAIIRALSSASSGLLKDIRSVYIFVDSQAAISRLQNCKGEKIVQQAEIACEKLTTAGVHVQIQWCPSHMGISGNEIVDTLAKQALIKPLVHHHTGVSLGHLRRRAKREILSI